MSVDMKNYSNIMFLMLFMMGLIIVGSFNTGFYGLYNKDVFEYKRRGRRRRRRKARRRTIKRMRRAIRKAPRRVGNSIRNTAQITNSNLHQKIAPHLNRLKSSIPKMRVINRKINRVGNRLDNRISAIQRNVGNTVSSAKFNNMRKDLSRNFNEFKSHRAFDKIHLDHNGVKNVLSQYKLYPGSVANFYRNLNRKESLASARRARNILTNKIKGTLEKIGSVRSIMGVLRKDHEQEKSNTGNRFGVVDGDLSNINERLAGHDSSIEQNATNISTNAADIAAIKTKNTEQDTKISQNASKIQTLQNEFSALKDDISTLAGVMADRTFRIHENIVPHYMNTITT